MEDLTGCGGNKGESAASSPQRQRVQSSRCGAGPLPQGCPKALGVPSRTTGGTQPRTTAPVPAFILSVPHTSLGAIKRAGGCPASTTSRRGFQLQASTLRGQRAEEGCSLPWHRPYLPPDGFNRLLDVWDCSDRAKCCLKPPFAVPPAPRKRPAGTPMSPGCPWGSRAVGSQGTRRWAKDQDPSPS